MQTLTGGQASTGLLNTLSSAVQVVSAASNAANTAQSLSSLASLLQQLTSSGSTSGTGSTASSSSSSSSNSNSVSGSSSSSTGSDTTTKSTFSHVITLLSALNNNANTNSGSNNNNGNNFSPLSAIVDYFMSVNPATISGLLPARRKKPLDLEDIASEAMTVSQVPPTPCPSIEEYVAPVYARNYQGVWKYVVQIPHEGYFTQTVQKTSCM